MNHHSKTWPLQEAKAKFSELVRRAHTEGPQTVTLHGEPSVVVSAIEKKSRLIAGKYDPTGTGLDLIRVMQSCPAPEVFDYILRARNATPVKAKRPVEFK